MSILGRETSSSQNDEENREHPNASAAGKYTLVCKAYPEDRESRPEPPLSAFDSATPIISIGERLARTVNHQLELMEKGEINQLSDQHSWQEGLSVSSSSASVTLSESDPSIPDHVQPIPTYAGVLSAPKAVTFTPNGVRHLPD